MIKLSLKNATKIINGNLIGADKIFDGVSTDSRNIAKDQLFFALKGLNFNGNKFSQEALSKQAAACVIDEKKFHTTGNILVNDVSVALGKLASAWKEILNTKVIAITGSNGKTSLKEIVANCLSIDSNILSTEGNYNNHIGLPLMLLKLNKEHEYAVLEMGANRPNEIEYLASLTNPYIAIINNAGPAHLEGFMSLDGVAEAKGEILQGDIPPTYAILNHDDRYFGLWSEMAVRSKIISFGLNSKATIYAKDLQLSDNYSTFKLVFPETTLDITLPILGKHNIMNAIAGAAILYALKKPMVLIKNGLETTQTIPGRLQLMKGLYGHCIIDDTYNANPTSTIAAIELLGRMDKINCLVFGDMKELGNQSRLMHESIGRTAKDEGIDMLVATGEMTKYTVSEFGTGGHWFESSEELLCHLHELIRVTSDMNILVKGSRSMQMERVINEITRQ
tara:strand:+ start:1205 stop:2554 length:1350 start_codon:yes stop_codon:yes gene_type:complete